MLRSKTSLNLHPPGPMNFTLRETLSTDPRVSPSSQLAPSQMLFGPKENLARAFVWLKANMSLPAKQQTVTTYPIYDSSWYDPFVKTYAFCTHTLSSPQNSDCPHIPVTSPLLSILYSSIFCKKLGRSGNIYFLNEVETRILQ